MCSWWMLGIINLDAGNSKYLPELISPRGGGCLCPGLGCYNDTGMRRGGHPGTGECSQAVTLTSQHHTHHHCEVGPSCVLTQNNDLFTPSNIRLMVVLFTFKFNQGILSLLAPVWVTELWLPLTLTPDSAISLLSPADKHWHLSSLTSAGRSVTLTSSWHPHQCHQLTRRPRILTFSDMDIARAFCV